MKINRLASVFMRSVLSGVLLAMATGCATVSMVSGETTVETFMTAEQSALRTASDAYCETAHEKGWAVNSNGLANLTAMLMHGDNAVERSEASYSDQIGVVTASTTGLVETIARDADAARLGLISVTDEARSVLSEAGTETARADVTSFERALVRAQRAHRNFTAALEQVSERTSDIDLASDAISRFGAEIDKARRVADDLAARYASIGEAAI